VVVIREPSREQLATDATSRPRHRGVTDAVIMLDMFGLLSTDGETLPSCA
jgi:hypothetical protein